MCIRDRFSDEVHAVARCGNKLIVPRYARFKTPRVELLDLTTNERRSVEVPRMGGWNRMIKLSPDERFLCLESRMARNTCHVIVDLDDTSKRHVISETPLLARPVYGMSFHWVSDSH